MPIELPERASLEYLRKLAKERLRALRATEPSAQLAQAQLAIAREYGAISWRALKAEIDRRTSPELHAFFDACRTGNVNKLRTLLEFHPSFAHERHRGGATGLHVAAQHPLALRVLLEHGANVNARDIGDNALALHFAAGGAPFESVEVLIHAGSDVHGFEDVHRLDVIGWATVFAKARADVVQLLLERGARHHIFSTIALGDLDALQRVVEHDPHAIARRLSRTEGEQTALHYVIAPPDGLVGGLFRTGAHYQTLELLLELGADVDAEDAKGRTPLAVAMLRGDQRAMELLQAAGAAPPAVDQTPARELLAKLAPTIGRLTPMLGVDDIERALAWYQAIGFEVTASHGEEGKIDWASIAFGEAAIMFVPSNELWRADTKGVDLWIIVSDLDALYERLKQQQLARAGRVLGGETTEVPEVRFRQDLYTAFYGQREFCIVDPNGVELNFYQPLSDTGS